MKVQTQAIQVALLKNSPGKWDVAVIINGKFVGSLGGANPVDLIASALSVHMQMTGAPEGSEILVNVTTERPGAEG